MKAISFWLGLFNGMLLLSLGIMLLENDFANAQVTSDGTTNTTVKANGNNFTILNGIEKGKNLFHSFSNFSVPTSGSATFDLTNTPNITTIFSRVTGGSTSNIDGLIDTSNGISPVSLFLMNPAGIIFGPNANLNIGGSFVGTTANSIKFSDGIEFSAQSKISNPLLSINVPIGLQMGSNPGAISVQGMGHRLAEPSFYSPIIQQNTPNGLGISPGNTLALIGGAISLDGGILLAPSGHIELGSLSSGSVGINTRFPQWNFDYSSVQQFADIRLSQQALVDASGAPAGSLHLQGRNISFLEGSVARLQNLGGSSALGDLVINASGLLEMRQVGTYRFPNNLLSAENLGSGTGSNLIISAQQLQVQDGGVITTKTFSAGAGGNITIKVLDSMDLDGWSAIDPTVATAIGAATLAAGSGGNLTVASNQLKITNGASILNLTSGTGLGGNMTVNVAGNVEIIGENPIILRGSQLVNTTLSQGNGGNLTLTASQVSIRDGANITTSTLAAGNGGNLTIAASDNIEVKGIGSASGVRSQIGARADLLPEVLRQAYGIPPFPTGNSGDLVLDTPQLQVSDRAIVGVDNQGEGNAGNLKINADRVILNQGVITAATTSGEGGNITLNLQELLSLRHNSDMTTTAHGTSNGGNITINSPVIIGLENSDIIANAVQGNGGNIQIATEAIFGLAYRPQLTPGNDITASSKFGVNGTVDIHNFGFDPSSGLVELPVKLVDSSQQIATGCSVKQRSRFVATGRGGIPENPNQLVTSNVYDGLRLRTWSDIRDISAYRKTGKFTLQTPTPETLVQATSWHRNAQGKIELVADQSSTTVQQALTCAAVPIIKSINVGWVKQQ